MARAFVTRGNLPLIDQLLDMYPWLSREDAERIAAECREKAEGSTSKSEADMQVSLHYYTEAQRLKPR